MPEQNNPNLPTYGLSEGVVEDRQPEVPNASFAGGGNEAGSNSPGIGINTGDYDPKPSDWSREERTPQQFGHIGLTPLGDVRVDNPIPGDLAYFVQAGGVTAPDAQIPGTGAFNRTGITVPSGAWLWGSSPGFAPESLALFAAMTPEPNDSQKLAIDNFMRNGLLPIWDKEDAFYVMHSYAEQPSLLNWKNPTESAVPVNSPVFFPFSGWQGDGVSTSITISTPFDSYALNDAHFGSSQAIAIGPLGTNPRYGSLNLSYYPRSPTNTRAFNLNSGAGPSSASVNETVLTIINRTTSASVDIYDDGLFTETDALASTSLAGNPVNLLSRPEFSQFGNMRINIAMYGGSLTPDEITALNDAWRAYKAAMGFDDNVTYELDTNTATGWVDDDAIDPPTVVDGTLVFNNAQQANGWTKTVEAPTSGDYIFMAKISSNDAGAPINFRIGTAANEQFVVSLGYNWGTASPEMSRVSAKIGATGFTGPLTATAGNVVEVAIQYDSRLGVGNFFMKEAGAWKFYGNAAMLNPYNNTLRVTTGGSALSTLTVAEAFYCLPNIVAIGDSIAKGSTLFSPDPAEYPGIDNYDSTWMAHAPLYPDVRNNLIVDYGIGGQTSAQIDARVQSMLDATSPRVVFLHSSSNDFGASVPEATRTANIQSSVNRITSAGAEAVLLNAVYPNAGSANYPANADYYRNWWNTFSADIEGPSNKIDIMVGSGILDGNYMNVIYTQSDGVHPNPTGYGLIGEYINDVQGS